MINFHKVFQPITSRPLLSSQLYTEYRPSGFLRPFVACYWSAEEGGAERVGQSREVLVIPDACMDILIHINHTKQSISGYLCNIQDTPFYSVSGKSTDEVSTFAIRFYFWAAHLFLNLNFKNIGSQNLDIKDLGSEWSMLFEPFFYITSTSDRIEWVERFLQKKLDDVTHNANLFNSFQQIVAGKGRSTVSEVCRYCCISQRQMERHFLQTVGLPMKRVSNLVRYQNVWRDMILSESFEIHDAVYRYGYTDQSHLLKEFKRYHSTTLEEAKHIAYLNR